MPLKIFILDSSDIVRIGLSELLHTNQSFEVVGETDDPDQAKSAIRELLPDIAILDLGSTSSERMTLVSELRNEFPGTKLLVFTSNDSTCTAQKLIANGIDGYILKDASKSEIIAAIKALGAGRKIVSLSSFERLFVDRDSEATADSPHLTSTGSQADLSEREREVLTRVARGLTNQQIADELFLSVKTIETYRGRVSKKVGASSRSELFQFANSAGMLDSVGS